MHPLHQRIVTALLVVTTCFGCTDKDREMARRTSDGSDTFKYVPPPAPSASSPKGTHSSDVDSKDSTKTNGAAENLEKPATSTDAVKSAASTSTTTAAAKSKSPSASASFQYRPDPRLLKQLSNPDGK
jgi:hypothetical protein